MVDYLYASNADQSCQASQNAANWATNNSQSSTDEGLAPWTTSQAMSGSPTIFPPTTFYDQEPSCAEVLEDTDNDNTQLSPRKSQLSHSRSFPGPRHPHSHSEEPSFRTASASLRLPQQGELIAYSFESHLSPTLFPTSSATGYQYASQDAYDQFSEFHQASLQGAQPAPTVHGPNFRSRSDSEGSGSWAGINTPITPADVNLNNNGYKIDFGPHSAFGLSHNHDHLRFNTSELPARHSSSAPINQPFASLPGSAQIPSALAFNPSDYQHHSTANDYAFANIPQLPFLKDTRPGNTRRVSVTEDSSQRSPFPLDHDILYAHRSPSPSSTGTSLQMMPGGQSYSRSLSLGSGATSRNRSASAALPDLSQPLQQWNALPLPPLPMSAHAGRQSANLQLDASDQLSLDFMFSKTRMPRREREALLAPYIRLYLSSSNRFLLGERTVLVLSGKVAQKSYGAEKRFLCPPPSALLLGCSWWAAADPDPRRPLSSPGRLALHPPSTIISMSGEHSMPTEAYCEWMSMSGHVVGDQASLDDIAISGRCVGKQLHISEVDEKTKKVEALVRVIAPGFGPPESRHIGTFPSMPIKVISKPSKKRQSIKNLDLCIHHGTTIALFNRLRSQTVSTKYLCVSGPSASFPAGDWRAMSGMEEKPFSPGEDATCFVARTSAWDPFIIYLVDPSKPATAAENTVPSNSPPPGYPRAPSNALPSNPNGTPVPIYYNQPVVLQCLSTAVVSPVMIIRKVDKGSTATGGASLEGNNSLSNQRDMPVAPGEILGDPVSQLHKIALEVLTDPLTAYMTPMTSAMADFPGSGSFLACLGENVGVHKAESGRQTVIPLMTPPPSASSGKSFGTSSNVLPESNYLASQLSQSLHLANNASDRTVNLHSAAELNIGSSDGGKTKRHRKTSASIVQRRPLTKNQSRAGSTSSSCGHDELSSESECGYPRTSHPYASRAWTIECGEPAVWTIVGCDAKRHTFWIPPVLINGKPSSPISAGNVSEVFTTPIPFHPIGFDTATPIPVISKYLLPNPALSDPQDLKMITIYGANLSPHLHVWFGDIPSPHVEYKCAEVIMAQPPNQLMAVRNPTPCQILLVSDDGIVFPFKVYFTSL